MIRKINSIAPSLRSSHSIFNALNTFQPNRQSRMFSQPFDIFPIQFWVDESTDGTTDTTAFSVRGDFTT